MTDANSWATAWWVLAGGAVGVELLTGTFYLLMIAVGLAAAALAAHAGGGMSTQLLTCALVGGGAVALWHWRREQNPAAPRATANKDVNMDIGEIVQIDTWGDDGQATVRYRGADWAASLMPGEVPGCGQHRIVEVLGSRLMVKPVASKN